MNNVKNYFNYINKILKVNGSLYYNLEFIY